MFRNLHVDVFTAGQRHRGPKTAKSEMFTTYGEAIGRSINAGNKFAGKVFDELAEPLDTRRVKPNTAKQLKLAAQALRKREKKKEDKKSKAQKKMLKEEEKKHVPKHRVFDYETEMHSSDFESISDEYDSNCDAIDYHKEIKESCDPETTKALMLQPGQFPQEFSDKMLAPFLGMVNWQQIKHVFWPMYAYSGLPELTLSEQQTVQKKVKDKLQYDLRGTTAMPPPLVKIDPSDVDKLQWEKLTKTFSDCIDKLLRQKESATLHDALVLLLGVPSTRHLHPLLAICSQRLRQIFNTRMCRYKQEKQQLARKANRAFDSKKYGTYHQKVKEAQRAQEAQFEQEYQIPTFELSQKSTQSTTSNKQTNIIDKIQTTTGQKDDYFAKISSVNAPKPIGDKNTTVTYKTPWGECSTFPLTKTSFFFDQKEKEMRRAFKAAEVDLNEKEQDYDSSAEQIIVAQEQSFEELGAAITLFTQNDLYRITQEAVTHGIRAPFSDYAMFQKFQAKVLGKDKKRVEVWKASL